MKKLIFSGVVAAIVAMAAGCATDGNSRTKEASGARLWRQNCVRCHNSRSPASYSDAQWEVAMLHMRIRANLTATEHKAILEFLQSGSQ